MKSNTVFLQSRATMFIPRFIGYTKANSDKYINLLDNAKAEALEIPKNPFSPIPFNFEDSRPWQIISGSFRLVFLPNKIDLLLLNVHNDVSKQKEFLATAAKVFNEIAKREDSHAVRLAYAPNMAFESIGDFCVDNFFAVNIPMSVYHECQPKRATMKFEYQVPESICEHDMDINYIIKLSSGEKRVNRENQESSVSSIIIAEVDINTKSQDGLRLGENEVCDFFDKAIGYSDKFVDNFIH